LNRGKIGLAFFPVVAINQICPLFGSKGRKNFNVRPGRVNFGPDDQTFQVFKTWKVFVPEGLGILIFLFTAAIFPEMSYICCSFPAGRSRPVLRYKTTPFL